MHSRSHFLEPLPFSTLDNDTLLRVPGNDSPLAVPSTPQTDITELLLDNIERVEQITNDSQSRTVSPVSVSSSSSNDSASTPHVSTLPVMDSNGKKIAVAQSTLTKHPPVLTLGTITPEAVSIFERHCPYHFLACKVLAVDQVTTIAFGFQDPLIQDWYFNDVDTWNAMTFAEFMTAFRKHWLKKNWESELRSRISRTH